MCNEIKEDSIPLFFMKFWPFELRIMVIYRIEHSNKQLVSMIQWIYYLENVDLIIFQ